MLSWNQAIHQGREQDRRQGENPLKYSLSYVVSQRSRYFASRMSAGTA